MFRHPTIARAVPFAVATTLAFAAAGPARAEEDATGPLAFSATFNLLSDYLFRGLSQNAGNPTPQASLEAAYTTPFADIAVYAGFFYSPVDFRLDNTPEAGSLATREFDYTAGVRGALGKFTWDLGVVRYDYNGNKNFQFDYNEAQLKLGYDFGFAAVALQGNYTNKFTANAGSGSYLTAGVTVPLPLEFSATGRIGRQWVENNVNFGAPDYTEWQISLSREILGGVIGSIGYYGTDISRSDLRRIGSATPYDLLNDRVVFGLSRVFTF